MLHKGGKMYLEKVNNLDWLTYLELFNYQMLNIKNEKKSEISLIYHNLLNEYSEVEILSEFQWLRALFESDKFNIIQNVAPFIYYYNKKFNEIELNSLKITNKVLKNLLDDLSYFRKLIYEYSTLGFKNRPNEFENERKKRLKNQVFESLKCVNILERQYFSFEKELEYLKNSISA